VVAEADVAILAIVIAIVAVISTISIVPTVVIAVVIVIVMLASGVSVAIGGRLRGMVVARWGVLLNVPAHDSFRFDDGWALAARCCTNSSGTGANTGPDRGSFATTHDSTENCARGSTAADEDGIVLGMGTSLQHERLSGD
jgi:hypothetical protein